MSCLNSSTLYHWQTRFTFKKRVNRGDDKYLLDKSYAKLTVCECNFTGLLGVLQVLYCHSKTQRAPYITTNSSWLHITTVPGKSGSPIKTGNLIVWNITAHTLVCSDAPAVKWADKYRCHICDRCLFKTKGQWTAADASVQNGKTPKHNHSSEANAQNNMVTAPLGLIIFPAHCYSLSMENYPRSFVLTWIVMSAWRGAMQRKRRHTNTNTLKHINVQKPPVGVWFTGWRLAETDDRAYCHRPVSLTAEPQSRCQHIAEKWLAF